MTNQEEMVSGWIIFLLGQPNVIQRVRVSSLMMRSLETAQETGPKISDMTVISTELDYLLFQTGIVHLLVESTKPVLTLGGHQID